MIVNSEFITKQITEVNKALEAAPAAGATTSKPAKPLTAGGVSADSLSKAAGKDVQWYKITTKVELKEFDDKRNFHGKKITYFVRPYTHYNASHPYAAQSQPKGAVKEYNYLYTGKNKDIIDFSLDFDTLFHTLVTVDPSKQAALVTNPTTETAGGGTGVGQSLPGYQLLTNQVVHNSGTMTTQTTVDEAAVKIKAANLADNIYMGSAGDMLKLNLKIIGDPHFIKQDEILFSADKLPNTGSQFVDKEGGSLATDNGEIFCKVIFKTPVDIDETSGLVRKNSAWKDVYFGGMFKVQKVTSEFRQGKFTQELFMIRQRNQEGDSKGSGTDANSAAQRSEPKTGPQDPALTKGKIYVDDDGSKMIVWENGEYAAIDTDGKLGKIQKSTTPGNAGTPDRPGPDPLQQAARDNAATVAAYEDPSVEKDLPEGTSVALTATGGTTTVVTNAGGAATSVSRQRAATPGSARDVALNGETATITDDNRLPDGSTVVGAESATTQAVVPPQGLRARARAANQERAAAAGDVPTTSTLPAPVVNEPVDVTKIPAQEPVAGYVSQRQMSSPELQVIYDRLMQARDPDEWDNRDIQRETELAAKAELKQSRAAVANPVTQTPPVQTAPQPAPATYQQRQETAATATANNQAAAAADSATQNASALQRARAAVDSAQAEEQAATDALTALNARFDAMPPPKSREEVKDRNDQRAAAAARLNRASTAFSAALEEVMRLQSVQEVKNNKF
jgi:hypothetical protein